MTEVRDFINQTDIPYLSIMNSMTWNQHLQQMKFDLKQIVLLTDTFNSIMSGLSDKVIYDIIHIIEFDKRENFLEMVTEKLDEINNNYSGFKTAMMTLLKNYSTNRVEMFQDLGKTSSLFLKNFLKSYLNEMGMIRSGDKIKNDIKMIIKAINFYEFDFDDELAENFHQILSFAVKTCKKRSDQFHGHNKDFSQILQSIKEGVRLTGMTNYMGYAFEHTESDRSLKKSSIDSLLARAEIEKSDGRVEHERLNELKKRSQDMKKLNELIAALREKIKQKSLTGNYLVH